MTDWREINERLDLRDRKMEQAILKDVGAQRALRTIVRGGADRTAIISLLVSCVHNPVSWRKSARSLKKQLESIADQLETVARHAERVHRDYLSCAYVMTLILHLFSGKWGQQDPVWDDIWERARSARGSSARILFGFVRLYAENCRERARHIGKMLRQFAPRQKRQALDTLILAVWHGTKKHHDAEVAYLLTRAFEVSGRKKYFSEDQIKKHRQRHVMPRIRQYLQRAAHNSQAIGEAGRVNP